MTKQNGQEEGLLQKYLIQDRIQRFSIQAVYFCDKQSDFSRLINVILCDFHFDFRIVISTGWYTGTERNVISFRFFFVFANSVQKGL